MNCEETRRWSHAFEDGELDVAQTVEIQEHLKGCAACQRAYENIRGLKTAVKSEELYFKAPAGLKRRLQTSLGKAQPVKQPSPWFSWLWLRQGLVVAGAAAIMLLVSLTLMRPSAGDRLAAEVTSGHLRSLMENHLMDVASTDQHTVKPWFAGKVDFSPPVVDLKERGFPLLGGRLDFMDNQKVAALVYGRNLHKINVFVWPAKDQSDTTPAGETRQGYNLIHWNHAGMTFWAVSDLNSGELMDFARLLK